MLFMLIRFEKTEMTAIHFDCSSMLIRCIRLRTILDDVLQHWKQTTVHHDSRLNLLIDQLLDNNF